MNVRFVKDARAVVAGAETEARELGSTTVEAEHLLLALARREWSPAGAALAGHGLDHARASAALEEELERSLRAVGVDVGGPLPGRRPTFARPRHGASFKLALERALLAARERGDKRIEPPHLLLGLLRADVGTVPRALDAAGADRDALRAAAREALTRATADTA